MMSLTIGKVGTPRCRGSPSNTTRVCGRVLDLVMEWSHAGGWPPTQPQPPPAPCLRAALRAKEDAMRSMAQAAEQREQDCKQEIEHIKDARSHVYAESEAVSKMDSNQLASSGLAAVFTT
jgi:hypothetical protein